MTLPTCITLDLEPDHAGRMAPQYVSWNVECVDRLLDLLARFEAPLSIFVVAESLVLQPKIIDRFARRGAEFHLHSFSHDLANADSREEILRGRDAFAAFFGRAPKGYRAPEGRITPTGLRVLEQEGFEFDSSVFPSFWPRPRYWRAPRQPYRPLPGLVEIPIATLSRWRLIASLSWMKLLGWPAYRRLLSGPLPEPLVFDMHLHDLWPLEAARKLAVPWRWIYRRNARAGFSILESFLETMRARGGVFQTVGDVAREAASQC